MNRFAFAVPVVAAFATVHLMAQTAPAAGRQAAAPAPKPATTPAAAGQPREVVITVGNEMKYSLATIAAKPGEMIKVVLKNTGTMPKMAMGHNFVLLKVTASAVKFSEASMMAAATEYIPDTMKDQILAKTTLTGPGETAEVTFKTPAAGTYNFLCSFPGHFAQGMRGTLVVK